MQQQEKCTLTWQTYSDHLREVMREMMTTSEFADVTLVTDDKQQLRAHRNILSAVSPVFKEILQLDGINSNSVIYLRGIQHSEIALIMQYIYLGEARLHKDRVNEFLMVSKNLEIKELSTSIENKYEENNEHKNIVTYEEGVEDVDPIKILNQDSNVTHELQTVVRPIIRNNKGYKRVDRTYGLKYACNQCDYEATHCSSVTRHIQSKHEGVIYACNQCDQQFKTQCNLTQHIQSKHEGAKYDCN